MKGKKPRLIFVPQYPNSMRYSDWYFTDFPKELKKYFNEIIILGENKINLEDLSITKIGSFSSVDQSIYFEQQQIKEFLNLQLRDNDILLLNDISYPGLFANILYFKRPKKCFAICHASSKNKLDFFASDRKSKRLIELGHSKLFKNIFVATNYHKEKLSWNNTIVTALPKDPFSKKIRGINKYIQIVSASRPGLQKVTKKLEKKVRRKFLTPIVRRDCKTWNEYQIFLAQCKVVLITCKEETFSYQVLDAIKQDSIPIAPNKFSFPELLSKDYLYSTPEELIKKVRLSLDGKLSVPKLKNINLINSFYKNISNYMLDD